MNATPTPPTLIAFTPSLTAAPPFSADVTLDNATYQLIVGSLPNASSSSILSGWNFYAGRWYFSLFDSFGDLIINQPLIGSPPNENIYLAPGIFAASTILYRVSTGNFEITP